MDDNKIFSDTRWSNKKNFFEFFKIVIQRFIFFKQPFEFFFKFCESIKVVHTLLRRFPRDDRIRVHIPMVPYLLPQPKVYQDELTLKFVWPSVLQAGQFPSQYVRALELKERINRAAR